MTKYFVFMGQLFREPENPNWYWNEDLEPEVWACHELTAKRIDITDSSGVTEIKINSGEQPLDAFKRHFPNSFTLWDISHQQPHIQS